MVFAGTVPHLGKQARRGEPQLGRMRYDIWSTAAVAQLYALSQQVFHWETQSGCHAATATGQRYQRIAPGGADGALLFVRASKRGERGETLPYTLLGPCYYRSHSGNRPMQIVWELAHPIPVEFYQEVKVAAG